MQNKFMKFGAKVTAAATMLAMFAAVSPAMADNATLMSDTLSRQALGATSDHTVTLTLPASFVNGNLDFTYQNVGAGWTFPATATGTCTPSGGTIADNTSASNVLKVTTTGCAAGDVATITEAAATNDDTTAGSRTVTITGTAATTGTFAVALDDSDQVTVTATVDPSITFDLNANLNNASEGPVYDVPFGVLTPGTVKSSDNAAIDSIWANLSTNASSGAVVTVLSLNAALKSTSAPLDTIPNAAAAMASANANYGLCVNTVTPPSATTGTFQAASPYNAGTCAPGGTTNDVKALSTLTPTNILNTAGGPVGTGVGEIIVNANANSLTAAHNDYTDVLTFVATGTF